MSAPTPPPAPPPLTRLPPSSTARVRGSQDFSQEVKYLVEPLLTQAEGQGKAVFTLVHYVEPVIQQGPMCGLVALSIAADLLTGVVAPPEQLLLRARERGYSKQGEMFSAQHLLDLALSELNCRGSLVHTSTLTTADILTAIAKKRALLVPYDADKDHSPCLSKGHRAHWCTLVGFALISNPPTSDSSVHVELSLTDLNIGAFGEFKTDQVYVFARQGKSRHMGLWGLADLLESNANLTEAGDKRDHCHYVIPSQGLSQSLSSLIVHLY